MTNQEPGSGGRSLFEQRRSQQIERDPSVKPDLLGNPRWLELLPDLDRLTNFQVALQLGSQEEANAVAKAIEIATHIEETYKFFAQSQGTVRKKIEQSARKFTSLSLARLADKIIALPPVQKANSTLEAEGEDETIAHLDDYRPVDESKSNEILSNPDLFKSVFMDLVNKENSGGPNQAEREYALALAFKQSLIKTISQQEQVDLAPTRSNRLISSHEAQKVAGSVTSISTFKRRKRRSTQADGDIV